MNGFTWNRRPDNVPRSVPRRWRRTFGPSGLFLRVFSPNWRAGGVNPRAHARRKFFDARENNLREALEDLVKRQGSEAFLKAGQHEDSRSAAATEHYSRNPKRKNR